MRDPTCLRENRTTLQHLLSARVTLSPLDLASEEEPAAGAEPRASFLRARAKRRRRRSAGVGVRMMRRTVGMAPSRRPTATLCEIAIPPQPA
ncbi:hypothetical protein SKAU_G00346940 [Synaphobranchus kaupii]|uniref:Uncharacterized protein n=1 Tax=Synaphobranchus kaupii TaxID=118154 RepID=A0A9Q1EJM4_SYNKA|nr:hypothetical protein SKAU_G00346940 [Synaphobranchus kaupii]